MPIFNTEYKSYYEWKPGENTLWYLNLDQSDAVFTDAMGHSTTNYGVTYNANGVKGGCGYNNGGTNVIQSLFNSGESFPSNFTIMGFMKPAGSHTNDHNKGICLGDASNKRAFYIGFATNNSSAVFGCMKLSVGWYEQTATPSSGNILNEWHHYAMTYDGNTMKGYIDGIQKFTYNISGSGGGDVSLVGFTLIGERTSSGLNGNCINGYIDEAICENKIWTASDLQTYLSEFTY